MLVGDYEQKRPGRPITISVLFQASHAHCDGTEYNLSFPLAIYMNAYCKCLSFVRRLPLL